MSDHGNYGYWWGSPGCEFRKFLCEVDDHYLMGKLSEGKREVDRDATLLAVKREILGCRRRRDITRDQAQAEWLIALEIDWYDEFERSDWYLNRTELREQMMEVVVRRFPMQLQMFVKWLWPVFVEELKKELAEEAVSGRGLTEQAQTRDGVRYRSW